MCSTGDMKGDLAVVVLCCLRHSMAATLYIDQLHVGWWGEGGGLLFAFCLLLSADN